MPAQQHDYRFHEEPQVIFEKDNLAAYKGFVGGLSAVGYPQIIFIVFGFLDIEVILPAFVAEHFRVKDIGEFRCLLFHFSFVLFGKIVEWEWHIAG